MGHQDSGPFDPPIGRQSSVVVLSRRFNDAWGDYRVVTTISTRSTTNVLEVNSSTGTLLFAADHSFTDEASALATLTRQGYMEIARGTTLLGYTATDTLAGLLLATKTVTKATLPGGHAINLVADARWELLPLDASSSATNNPLAAAEEQEFWRSMQQHTVGGVHYYCETADITRPFPSAHPPTEPELEFVWNAWLSQPLRDIGLHTHCPALMQGAVEAVDEVHHPTGQRYTLCLLSRRSRRHPGTRYIARGLNEMAGPGNEIEAELIMWTPSAGSSSGGGGSSGNSIGSSSSSAAVVKWARVAWRRGTVPIWWGVELQPLNKGLQAEVYVKEDGPYVGMLSYVRTLQRLSTIEATGKASGSSSSASSASRDDVVTFTSTATETPAELASTGTENNINTINNENVAKVTFINLLHCNPKKAAELMLSSHFEEGMAHVKARLAAETKAKTSTIRKTTPCPMPVPLSLKKFDWHGVMAMLNEEQGIEAFWTFIEHSVKNTGLAVGVMERKRNTTASSQVAAGGSNGGGDENNNIIIENKSGQDDVSPWGEQWNMRWLQRQNGLLRFNCADSLDRTNAATCFAMLPVVQEGLRLLGIQLETSMSGKDSTNSKGEAAILQSPLRAGASLLASSTSRSSLQDSGTGEKQQQQQGEERTNTITDAHAVTEAGFVDTQESKKVVDNQFDEQIEEVLPEGWERRDHAGRAVYIDHVNRVTQWEPPPGTTMNPIPTKLNDTTTLSTTNNQTAAPAPAPAPDDTNAVGPPWAFFKYRLEDVRTKLHADTLSDYVTMFRKHGDVHSALYTGSPAMHSHVLGLVLSADARPYGASSSSVGKLQNLRVAVQRRWNNSVSDSARQQCMELFLGLNVTRYFPRVTVIVPPHQAGLQSDLLGIDVDDTLEEEEGLGAAHVGAELETLHLKKHDGRLGLQEEITNLEPLEPQPQALPPLQNLLDSDAAPVADSVGISSFYKDEDEEETLDPLGAVKSPIKSIHQQSLTEEDAGGAAGGGGSASTAEFSLI